MLLEAAEAVLDKIDNKRSESADEKNPKMTKNVEIFRLKA
jgi:hypothetical protein